MQSPYCASDREEFIHESDRVSPSAKHFLVEQVAYSGLDGDQIRALNLYGHG